MALHFPKEIYEGLRIPSGPTKDVKFKVRELVVKPKLTKDEINEKLKAMPKLEESREWWPKDD